MQAVVCLGMRDCELIDGVDLGKDAPAGYATALPGRLIYIF